MDEPTTRYYHGGSRGLKVGQFILPPSETGKESASDFGAEKVHRKDRVYVSTTVLCFKHVTHHPLYSEPHAVNGAAFFARPEIWREKKRKSIYELLEPELTRFPG